MVSASAKAVLSAAPIIRNNLFCGFKGQFWYRGDNLIYFEADIGAVLPGFVETVHFLVSLDLKNAGLSFQDAVVSVMTNFSRGRQKM